MPPAAPAQNSAQALQNLQSYAGSTKSPEQDLQQQQQNLGVTAAQQTVTGLRGAIQNTTNLLSQVAPSVMGRTANSLVTSAQADQQINNEQAPLNTQLNTENQNYTNANSDYTNLQQQAEDLANADQTGQQNQESYLQNIYNNLYTQEQNTAQQAEAKREFDAQQQLAASSAAAGSSNSGLDLSGLSGLLSGGSSGAETRNAVGGYAFTNAQGQPVTMAQYLAGNGYGSASDIAKQAAQLLAQGSTSDKQIAAAINSGKYSPQQLAQLYPQVFGGSF